MNLIIDPFKNNLFVYPYRFGARPDHELSDLYQSGETFVSDETEETPRDMADLKVRNPLNKQETKEGKDWKYWHQFKC